MSGSKRLAFFLPNMFTALNMACGFASVTFAMNDRFYAACIVLILGAVFDSVDGRVARMTGTQSSFGEQFDSLSDAISFGFAPSLLVYMRFFQDLGRLGLAVSFIFLLCGTLRLARFNANIDKVTSEYFQGLPSPAAAMALIGLILFSIEFPVLLDWTVLPFIYVLFYAFLMISTIPFNSFKNSTWAKKHKRFSLFVMMILLVLTLTYEQFMIAGGISFYVIGSLIYFFTHKGALEDVLQWKTDTDGDA